MLILYERVAGYPVDRERGHDCCLLCQAMLASKYRAPADLLMLNPFIVKNLLQTYS
jgi:hypothetical protein